MEASSSILDTKLGKVGVFSGLDQDWQEWSFICRAYASLLTPSMSDHMMQVESVEVEVDMSTISVAAKSDARTLFFVLLYACKGTAALVLRRVRDSNGLEAWRRLVAR